MSTELARYQPRDLQLMAENVAKSGLFGMNAAQTFTLMLLAESKGLHPIAAMERYHVIQGRPTMKADAMLAEFQAQGGTVEWVTRTDLIHEAIFTHPVQVPKGLKVSFSIKDAERAELLKNPMWKKYPQNMLRARVISNGIRLVLPGIVSGIYTPEEVEDMEPRQVGARVVEAPEPEPIREPVVAEDPERHRARLKARADVAKPWGIFLTDATAEAWAALLAACDAEGVDRPDEGTGPNVHQLHRHLLKWSVAEGLVGDLGTISRGECAEAVKLLWDGCDMRGRALLRMELLRYLEGQYKALLESMAHDAEFEPDEELKQEAGAAAERN